MLPAPSVAPASGISRDGRLFCCILLLFGPRGAEVGMRPYCRRRGGPVAAAPGRHAGRHFGLWCTECSGVSLLTAARLDGLSCRSPVPMQGAEPPGATLLFAAAIRILSVRLAPGPASGGPRDGRLFCCPRGPRTGCSLK